LKRGRNHLDERWLTFPKKPAFLASRTFLPALSSATRRRKSIVSQARRGATNELPNKLYFRIGEVAKIVGVKPYVLRYWETEFSILKPEKHLPGIASIAAAMLKCSRNKDASLRRRLHYCGSKEKTQRERERQRGRKKHSTDRSSGRDNRRPSSKPGSSRAFTCYPR
jgi:hypothetical protein